MAEKWTEYYTANQLKGLQRMELDLLREFISVCITLHLEYVIYGGTLLGYEKYGGMIPWDDDIDVALPRESYNKFVRMADKILPEGYFLQTPYNSKLSPYPYAKLRKKGTKYVEYINRNLNIETGIYIDIYPIDKIPDNERLRKKQFKKVRKWILMYVYRQSRLYDKKEASIVGKIKNLAKWIICHMTKVFSQKYCVRKIDHYMNMYNDKETNRYAALNSPNINNIYDGFYPLEQGRFNGIDVWVPANYKEHLKKRYGDYSKDLPEEERVGHIPYILEMPENE